VVFVYRLWDRPRSLLEPVAMKHVPVVLVLVALFAPAVPARAGDPAPKPAPKAAPSPRPAPVVSVPTFENKTCPIMAKPSSKALFTDTAEHGRIYVCCTPCVPKIKADQERAYAAAYPAVKKVGNTVDPLTGETLGADAATVSLQGYEVRVAPQGVQRAQANAQIVLTKVLRPKVVDVGNRTSPISGKPVADNTFVLVDDELLRLASAAEIEEVERDPEKARKAAKEIAARQTAAGPVAPPAGPQPR
jgi:hypothetical protein